MRTLLGTLVMTTGLLAVNAVAQDSECIAPRDEERFEFEDPVRSTIRLEWRAPREDAKVRLQMSSDPEFGRLVFDREICCETRLRSLEVGRYHWRVMDGDAEVCRASFEVARRD